MNARLRFAAGLVGLACAASAGAQGYSTASDTYLSQINRIGSPTIDGVLRSNINSSRAQAAGNGIQNFMVTNNGGLSSGGGRTPSTANLPTLPGVGGGAKPFTNLDRGPTVSPYLNLFSTGIGGSSSTIDNYNVLVRPQLDQQRVNRQLEAQTQRLNQRVQQISAQPAMQPQGSEQIMATGHATVFGYYSHYYQQLGRRR